ncbi:DNA-binding transcriptional LysR family regulator [Paenibacillus phyllosphaerae]|uniref:DNA-binding transcriptional LysR family regulator n=1 Tax=Paenibacillus phyllosphaerae TaxID=274593 RepID=A0A7W5FM39_9BACL|nr:LysR family transcriptional regulator [Paenibacillus phyllosphaerae]MBB3109589.1 DNA-binding transcriptional LysR family regulator [Paenibacillus phyllosphaerae]
MNIEQLEYIVEIAKTGSLSAAANELHVTQSALSQSVSRLEEELGIKIFQRSHAGAVATEEGRRILKKALEALHAIDEMKENALLDRNMMQGELDVASFPGVMPLLVKAVSSIKQEYPLLRVTVGENYSMQILEDIRANRLGLGLIAMYAKDIERLTGLAFEPIVQGKLVICANKKSPIAQHSSIHPRELKKHDLVLYQGDSFLDDFVTDYRAAYGDLSILFSTNNGGAIDAALSENLAITIGHDFSFYGNRQWLADQYAMIDIAPFAQQPMQVGWVKSEKKQMSSVYQLCVNRFKHELDRKRI